MLIGELVDPEVATDLGGIEGLQGAGLAYAVDVGEGDLEALVAREINTNEACHEAGITFRLVDAGLRGCALEKLRRMTSRRCLA